MRQNAPGKFLRTGYGLGIMMGLLGVSFFVQKGFAIPKKILPFKTAVTAGPDNRGSSPFPAKTGYPLPQYRNSCPIESTKPTVVPPPSPSSAVWITPEAWEKVRSFLGKRQNFRKEGRAVQEEISSAECVKVLEGVDDRRRVKILEGIKILICAEPQWRKVQTILHGCSIGAEESSIAQRRGGGARVPSVILRGDS